MADELTVNVDVGGTFTDGFFVRGDERIRTKVPTTEHDVTVCFADCIERGAEALGLSTNDLLDRAAAVRFSTTLGTNTVIEKTGPQLGVLVTAGHESTLYADGNRSVVDAFVRPELVEGLDEHTAADGTAERAPDPTAVVDAAKRLQARGARAIAIAFRRAFSNPEHERVAKRALKVEYPGHYLGAVPALASHEVTARPDDYRRLNTVVVNAYLHRPMKTALYRAEDRVRSAGHGHPLLIAHSSGGCARVAKTIALNTYNSGPAAGAVGARALADLYGEDLVAADMGGTSIDISVVRDGTVDLDLAPETDGLPVHVPAIDVRTVGAGGGSIASVGEDGELSVGPESAGASPGPACYGQGGQAATVTDADVVRGVVNPGFFLGGRRELHADRAREAIDVEVADPLGVGVEPAAAEVARRIESTIAAAVRGVEGTAEADLLCVYGGAGPVHAAGFAREIGLHRVVITPYSSVFSAFGESLMGVAHTYTRPLSTVGRSALETEIERATAEAQRDMAAEGYGAGGIDFSVDVLAHRGAGESDTLVRLGSDPETVAVEALEAVSDAALTLRVHAEGAVPTWTFAEHELADTDPSEALVGERTVSWPGGAEPTAVYRRSALVAGNRLSGPAVVEARDTTIAVPPGATFEVNAYGHGILEL